MNVNEIDKKIRDYYESKNRCPVCNSRNLADTEIHILDMDPKNYRDRKNITICKECGWRGYIDDLKK